MEEPLQIHGTLQRSLVSLLKLPLELRNIVYEILIDEATVIGPSPALKHDVQISTKKIKYPHLRLPSNLIYTSRQIYIEFSTLICSHIYHLKVSGDFMMGLSSTAAIFEILARRPWIANSIRTVNVSLKLNHVLPVSGGVAVNKTVLQGCPWLGERLRIAELKVSLFELEGSGMHWIPEEGMEVIPSTSWGLQWCLRTIGVKFPVTRMEKQGADLEGDHGHNTLPDLARRFEMFALLEEIDIETEHRNLLSLLPAPRDMAESFQTLIERGVEVNVLVKKWQMESFRKMLHRNGMETRTIGFRDKYAKGKTALPHKTRSGGKVTSFRLLDCVVRPEEAEEADPATTPRLFTWRKKVVQ